MKKIYNINNIDQLNDFAQNFARVLNQGDIISLKGTLGSGKTTFVQHLIHFFDNKLEITSPTFAIANEYKTQKLNFVHIDAYRLDCFEDFLDEYFEQNNVVLIEWFEKLQLPKTILTCEIEFIVVDENKRQIIIRSKDEDFISNTCV